MSTNWDHLGPTCSPKMAKNTPQTTLYTNSEQALVKYSAPFIHVQASSATTYFWNRLTLRVSEDISDFGPSFNAWLLLCHVVAWILVFVVVAKGVESTGKGRARHNQFVLLFL